MTITEVAYNIILDNMSFFAVLIFIYLILDILGWAFLGRRK